MRHEKYYKILRYILSTLALTGLIFYAFYSYLFNQEISKTILNIETRVLEMGDNNLILQKELSTERGKNTEFQTQIGQIVGTVSNLDKLSKTDKELLQKYSKVYFLNEHYVPSELVAIPKQYLFDNTRFMQIHAKVLPKLEQLILDAEKDGVPLKIISAYRSFGDQTILKNGYSVVYGSGANRFSADQGYSEHQLGTTVDFTTPKTGTSFDLFKNTESYKWLLENAHIYGFILSYPEENEFYEFEPWHWRFVGVNLAKRLKEDGQSFYNVNQSVIDAYLLSIFD
jgi:LAS superfamily LD-carboxypeptidase LdcB